MEACDDDSSSSTSRLFSQGQGYRKNEIQPPPPPPPYNFQRPLSKITKKPVAPLPLARPRVYKVDANNFRELVQKLTGSNPLQACRLQTLAPPPIEINPSSGLRCQRSKITVPAPIQADYYAGAESSVLMSTEPMEGGKVEKVSDSSEFLGFLPLNSSPTYHHLCFFPLLSPGTITCLEQNILL